MTDTNESKKTVEKDDSQVSANKLYAMLQEERASSAVVRSAFLIAAGIAVMVPLPFNFLAIKFVLLIFLGYASVFNILHVFKIFGDEHSGKSTLSKVFSVLAAAVVLVVFFYIALHASALLQYWYSVAASLGA